MKKSKNNRKTARSSANRLNKHLTRMVLAGLLFSGSNAVWAPPAFADNVNVTIHSQADYDSHKDASSGDLALTGSNNTLTIDPTGQLTAAGDVAGGYSTNGDTNYNTVTITGGTFTGMAYGGYSTSGDTNYNTVTITGGTFTGGAYGGYSSMGDANHNTVTIAGGTFNHGAGGGASAITASNNTLTIRGGSFTDNVFGGYGGTASNNTVTIAGGSFNNASVYGGVTMSGTVTNNTLIINPQSSLDLRGANLYGSNITDDYDTATGTMLGNTLKVYGKNITANNIANFSNLYFYLPSAIANNDTVLTLTDTNGTDISKSTVKAGIAGNANIAIGDTITLLKNTSGIITTGTTYGTLTEGVSIDYGMNLSASGTSVIATVTSVPTTPTTPTTPLKPQTKSLVETRASAAAFLNSGVDMISGKGITNAREAASQSSAGFTPFTALGGSSMRYHTGSYVDNRGYNLALGFARDIGNKTGKLTFGPLIEAGWGSYDSYLDSGIHGSGNTKYYGLGFLARQENKDGLYYEGSLHYGRITSDYNSTELEGSTSENYETRAPYYGLHLGVGKISKRDDNSSLDVYCKYYYSHQNKDIAILTSGETYDFDGVTSNRVRVGTRYTHNYGAMKKSYSYIGAAYEYEFDGNAKASYKGYSTLTPSLKGGSGMLEVGCKVTPSKTSPLTIDISLNGWTGKQQGIGANVSFNWGF